MRALVSIAPAVPQLPDCMEFLVTLLADQNFKIALTTVQILGLLVEKFQAHMESSLAIVVPPMIEKLGEITALERWHVGRVCRVASSL